MESNKKYIVGWGSLILGVLAILAIKSIFEDDSSKIVSKKGRKFLSDDSKMENLNQKMQDAETEDQYNEILL